MRRPKVDTKDKPPHRGSEGKEKWDSTSLSINPKRARMGSLLVLDCTLYILEYMWAARGYP